jgi:hypothetical protein
MTNHIAVRNRNLLAVAAIAASALFGLTACGSDAAKPSAAGAGPATPTVPAVGAPSTNPSQPTASQSQSPTTSQPAQTTQPSQADQSQNPSHPASKPATTTAASPGPKPTPKKTTPASTLPGDCTATQLKATVSALTRPINHLLLTVTNTGKAACSVYYYPDLRFDADQQSVTQAVEDSKPQAVVTLAPGESAYAAIGTSAADGSGGHGKVEKQVEVFLESRNQSGSLPGSLTLPLPASTYVDEGAFVTYWQSDLQSAVVW